MINLCVEGWESQRLAQLAGLLSGYSNLSGSINAAVVPAAEVQALNQQYADSESATDVLSFSYIEETGAPTPSGDLGDIVISRQHISAQASAAGTSEEAECLLLLAHGCLHILGYDHTDMSEREEMDAIQATLMEALGLPYRNFGWHAADYGTVER